ncbi:MAG: hypothetical protein R6U62_00980 [Bacteroidales bacterium]
MEKKLKALKVIKQNLPLPDANKAAGEGQEVVLSETEYDAGHGKVILERQYNEEGQLEQETEYTYDDDGFMVREVLREGDGMVVEDKSYESDENLRIAREYLNYADGSRDTVHYAYDDQGRLIQKTLKDEDGDVEQTDLFVFDAEGRLVREAVYEGEPDEGEESLTEEKRYVYDEEGRLLETEIRDRVEESYRKRVNAYDEAGQRTSVMVYDADGELLERILFDPDDQGRPVEVVEENRRQKNTIQLQYDDHGNVVLQEEYDLNGNLVNRVERTYDKDGRFQQSRVRMHMPDRGINRYYVVKHSYEFF